MNRRTKKERNACEGFRKGSIKRRAENKGSERACKRVCENIDSVKGKSKDEVKGSLKAER